MGVRRRLALISDYTAVLQPNGTGVIVYVVLAFAILSLQLLPAAQSLLNIPTSWHISSIVLSWISSFLTALLGSSHLNTLVLNAFWILVGLVVYILGRAIALFISQLSDNILESRQAIYSSPETVQLLKRGLFQLVFLIITGGYLAWQITFLSREPYRHVTVLGHLLGKIPYAQDVWLFILECLTFYILTLLLRLTFFRFRLFG